MPTTKRPRSTKGFATLDGFLDAEGTREAFQAVAIKEVLAWQIGDTPDFATSSGKDRLQSAP
jgi:hypothetical protein